jgi:hypothetical protein
MRRDSRLPIAVLLCGLIMAGAGVAYWSALSRSIALERERLAYVAAEARRRAADRELLKLVELPQPVDDEQCDRMRYLLTQGASPSLGRSDGWTVLMLAASADNEPLVREALERGAIPDAKSNWGFTALMFASSPEVAGLILDYGADVNAKSIAIRAAPLRIAVSANALRRSTAMTPLR